jgi:uncharacterized protein
MARIAVFGGTGYAGGHIAREATSRGHEVTSYSRSAAKNPATGIRYETGTLADSGFVDQVAQTNDVIVVAMHSITGDQPDLLEMMPAVVDAAIANGTRVGVVGGAGSSYVSEGGPRLIETPEFNEDWKPEAYGLVNVLAFLYETDPAFEWFMVSPAALFGSYAPGETTGHYRVGGDVLVVKDDGSSEISGADYALAFVDEIENNTHSRERFTVGH